MAFWDNFFKKKAQQIETEPKKQNLGATWNSQNGQRPVFPARDALEAYGDHGYLYAAITRVTEDLSALPLRLIKGKGKDAKIIDSHPVLDLLHDPSTMMDGYLFRQTITLDLILNGTFFVLLIGAGKLPTSLIRLHPEETTFVTDDVTGISGVKNTSYGQTVQYPINKVYFGRNASYTKGPKSLYGTGVVQPLFEELRADYHAQQLCSQSSKQGKPDVLISPTDPSDVWNKDIRQQIVDSYTQMAKNGGAIALSGMAKIDMLNLTPRDMEFQAVRTFSRESISSAIGIPPTILGIPDSNYATSREQRRTYWTNQRHKAGKLESVYTKIAKLWDKDFRIVHDFSKIDALNTRDEQLARVEKHVALGMSPIDAYAYEGLEDAPIRPDFIFEEEEVEQEDEKILSDFITKDLQLNQRKERLDYWYKWVVTKQAPAENKLIRASTSFLRAAKRQAMIAYGRLDGVYTTAESLISMSELEKLCDRHMKDIYKKIYQDNLNDEINGLKSKIDRSYVHKEIEVPIDPTPATLLGGWLAFYFAMRSRIVTTTIKKLNKFFSAIDPKEDKDDVASKMAASGAFALSRSNVIGRTESTILVNNSTMEAANEATKDTPTKRPDKQWITEGDSKVREAHEVLDGTIVNNKSNFVIPSGEFAGSEAFYPGAFGSAALDCNCRCAIRIIIEDE